VPEQLLHKKLINYVKRQYFFSQVDIYQPSNTYDLEYYLISYKDVYTLLTKLLQKFQKVTREKWQKVYTKFTKGTVEFANRVTMCIFEI